MIRKWEDRMPRRLPEDELITAVLQVNYMLDEINELRAELEKQPNLPLQVAYAANNVLHEEVATLKAKLAKHCNCEFEGDENTVQCALHNSWASTLHEQAGYRRELDLAKAELVNLKPFADVGMQMVDITTTVRGQDEWGAIPTLWLMCMNERDAAWEELKKLKEQ